MAFWSTGLAPQLERCKTLMGDSSSGRQNQLLHSWGRHPYTGGLGSAVTVTQHTFRGPSDVYLALSEHISLCCLDFTDSLEFETATPKEVSDQP